MVIKILQRHSFNYNDKELFVDFYLIISYAIKFYKKHTRKL